MKKLTNYTTFLITVSFLFYGCAGTQDLAPDGTAIPIGVNTIIAHTNQNQESAFQDVGQFLIRNGYTIENSSPEFYSLTTAYKEASRGSGLLQVPIDLSISVSVLENDQQTEVIFSGKYRSEYGEDIQIEQKGASGSVWRITWNDLYSLAKSYSDSLTFETR